MKTCKDCIYYQEYHRKSDQCRFYPKPIDVYSHYWCGQLKEKSITRETFDKIWDEAHKDDPAKYQVYVDSEGVSRYRKMEP